MSPITIVNSIKYPLMVFSPQAGISRLKLSSSYVDAPPRAGLDDSNRPSVQAEETKPPEKKSELINKKRKVDEYISALRERVDETERKIALAKRVRESLEIEIDSVGASEKVVEFLEKGKQLIRTLVLNAARTPIDETLFGSGTVRSNGAYRRLYNIPNSILVHRIKKNEIERYHAISFKGHRISSRLLAIAPNDASFCYFKNPMDAIRVLRVIEQIYEKYCKTGELPSYTEYKKKEQISKISNPSEPCKATSGTPCHPAEDEEEVVVVDVGE